MGAIAFGILFLIGFLLATIGSIIGIVDAFQVNIVWGLLALFVPFALLVFWIRFFRERKWARNSLFMSLGGTVAMLLGGLLGGASIANFAGRDDDSFDQFPSGEADIGEDDGFEDDGFDVDEGDDEAIVDGEEDDLFQSTDLPNLPSAAEIALAELLPSTDANERLKEIERDRSDPFAFVPIPPPSALAPPPPEDRPTPTGGNNAGGGTQGGGTQGGGQPAPSQAGGRSPRPTASGNNTSPGATSPGNGGVTQPDLLPIEPLPDLPEPAVVASQVQIFGVAETGGEMYAIVQAPGEPTSRYVRVGDRLSNGAVLVKRIETRPSSEPLVILEERGIEVALPVGATGGDPEGTTALQPPSTSSEIASLPSLF